MRPFLAALALFLPAAALAQPKAPAVGPESHASLLARAPVLGTDGRPVPLAAPLAIGGAGWGPFKRFCVTRHLIQPDGREVPETDPSCFTVTAARQDGAAWQLELLTDPLRGSGPRVPFAASRDAEGQVGAVTVTPPQGADRPPEAMMARLQTLLRVMLEAHGMRRTTVAPQTGFRLALALAEADPDTTVEGGGFACLPDGTATLRARAVLAATCRATARTDLGDGAVARIDIAGRFAIDTETGMVLRYRYASFLFMERDPGKTMPNLRWRGVSRQDLE